MDREKSSEEKNNKDKSNKAISVGPSLIETLTVALYENPIVLFREYVQNSLDAYNKAVDNGKKVIKDFYVDIKIDALCKKIVIKDNGYGIENLKSFNVKMRSIGGSDKEHDRTKYIGFRGIGRLSGLPFCQKLIFRNRAENSDKINICIWEGEKYRKLLEEVEQIDLETIIKEIVTIKEEPVAEKEKAHKHFFEVVLENYTDEIEELMNEKFKQKLIKMLPLRYSPDFRGAKTIVDKYNSFILNEPLERFMISVKLDGQDLMKGYDDSFILGSKIIFWEIRGKRKRDGSIGDKIGLLWFTFDKHLKSNNNDEYYGILTRSKNVLMGTNDTFAQVANNNKLYITTFREMAQGLRGLYGELLINSPHLRDNSRRDWFLPDQYSTDLNNIISDFVRRLHNYRYCASRYFRDEPSKGIDDLKKTLDEFVNINDNKINYDYFYQKEKKPGKDGDESLSEQDIPQENLSMKKYYDILMTIIEQFLAKEKNRVLFLKLRAYMANHFKKK